ncbi:MAG: GntR family transcriptional regulator/MocR family aminotransferase [Gammaproteobacteria bacterium]
MTQFSSIDLRSVRIDRDQQETIFSQLCRQLRELVLSGDLPLDARLPSTRMLSSEIGISRITVREVYEQLIAEGLLISTPGKGTFVSCHSGVLEAISAHTNEAPVTTATETLSAVEHISKRARAFLSLPLGSSAREPLPFNPSVPDLKLFPSAKWNTVVRKSLLNHKYESMDYGDPLGFPELREALAHYLRLSRGIKCDASQIIITASSEQTIRRTVFLLLDEADSVCFGEPGIYSRRYAFSSTGVNTITLPVDDQGVVVKSIYKHGRNAKLAYVLPYRHYPLGITMSLQRRRELLEWANNNNSWILEDDFASEFGLPENSPPPIQSLDENQRVIYMGGFSLTLFPALRLSYVVYPRSLLKAAESIAKSELSVSTALQPALADFIANDHYVTHIRNMRKVYQRREDFLLQYLNQHLDNRFSVSGMGGGTNLVLDLPPHICANDLSQSLARHNIIAYPASSYYLGNPLEQNTRNALVLGFASSSRDKLEISAALLMEEIRNLDF